MITAAVEKGSWADLAAREPKLAQLLAAVYEQKGRDKPEGFCQTRRARELMGEIRLLLGPDRRGRFDEVLASTQAVLEAEYILLNALPGCVFGCRCKMVPR
jgi:hypothetical protein